MLQAGADEVALDRIDDVLEPVLGLTLQRGMRPPGLDHAVAVMRTLKEGWDGVVRAA